jgi:carboxymethylenebutenolidase
VVLFYMDAPGKREELHDMARRLASVGYYVVLPNLYYRKVREFELKVRTPEGMAPMFELMNSLTNALVVRDTEAMLRYVDSRSPAADASRVGAVGYCMSGPFVFAAAAAFPTACSPSRPCIRPTWSPTRPTRRTASPSRIRCETYVGCAQTDKWAPPETVQVLEQAMQAGGMRYRLEWYPGAEHGFVFPRREGIYHRDSAERHWERLFALFGRTLRRADTVGRFAPPSDAARPPLGHAGGMLAPKQLFHLAVQSVKAWSDDYAPSMGAAISYYTVFSLAPLLVIVIAIAGAVFGHEAVQGLISAQLSGLVGAQGAEMVEGLIASASDTDRGLVAGLISIVVLLVGATTVFAELQSALDRIWKVPRRRSRRASSACCARACCRSG